MGVPSLELAPPLEASERGLKVLNALLPLRPSSRRPSVLPPPPPFACR